jgi:hypothetical protein
METKAFPRALLQRKDYEPDQATPTAAELVKGTVPQADEAAGMPA